MAFLVLALSVMPCADAGAAIKDGKTKSAITKTMQQDHNDNDACSPFCHCACCAGFSINHLVASVALTQFNINSPKSSFLPSEVIEVVLPIWQPPKVIIQSNYC